MSEISINDAKSFLKTGENNLYDHIVEVLQKIIIEKPKNAFQMFEQISSNIKDTSNIAYQEERQRGRDKEKIAQTEAVCAAILQLAKPLAENEVKEAPGTSDFLDESNILEWSGISFSKGENYRLATSLELLARRDGISNLRLWGKILGKDIGFYVAEGQLESSNPPENTDDEEASDGLNKHTYWVMKDDGSWTWQLLPNIQRQQILQARKKRRFIGRNLEENVEGFPSFPWSEASFIRAQIARISSSTIICPKDLYGVQDDGKIELLEEAEAKNADELLEPAGWVHLTKEINEKYGRTTPMPSRQNDDGEDVPWEDELFSDPLRSLSEDNPGSWRLERAPLLSHPCAGEVIVAKSLVWPGAVTMALGKKFINFYVGYGMKCSSVPWQLPALHTIQTGFESNTEGNAVFSLQEEKDITDAPQNENEDETEE